MRMLERYHDEIAKMYSMRELPLEDLACVDIEPAVRWVFEDNQDKHWDWREDFPVVAPPWPNLWMESGLGTMWPHFNALGFRIFSRQIPAEYSTSVLLEDVWLNEYQRKFGIANDDPEGEERRKIELNRAIANGQQCGWLMQCNAFLASRSGIDVVLCRKEYLDLDGGMIHGLGFTTYQAVTDDWDDPSMDTMLAVETALLPAFFALSLLHCKNVTTEDAPLAPAKVLKKRQKNGIPEIRFKTLVVEPMRKRVVHERDADPNGEQSTVKRALHIARGHFKDYRETGLFGKYHGVYWWDMQVRGSASAGTVVKDYRLETTGIES